MKLNLSLNMDGEPGSHVKQVNIVLVIVLDIHVLLELIIQFIGKDLYQHVLLVIIQRVVLDFMRILVHYQVIKFVELVIQVLIALEIILEYVLLALLHVLMAHIGVLIVQHHQTECVYLVH